MDILAAEVAVPPRPRRMSLAWSLCTWVTPELELTSGAVLATRGRPSDMRATKPAMIVELYYLQVAIILSADDV
eukprot:scaffold6635_cov116-Skeletonema_marinoi.AAC.2